MKSRIESIQVIRQVDQSPDLSYLGEYSNFDDGHAIDRQSRGDAGRNEYRYFNPAMTGDETGNPDSPEQDYQRMEAYNRGDWCMMGVRAVAEVIVNGTIQRISSAGLWGIESDSDKDYLEEVAREQLAELSAILAAIRFGASQIKRAMPVDVELIDA